MIFLLIKIIVTAGLIVLISEIAKVNDKLGGLIAAMPIMTLLVILWMYYEGNSDEKISSHMSRAEIFPKRALKRLSTTQTLVISKPKIFSTLRSLAGTLILRRGVLKTLAEAFIPSVAPVTKVMPFSGMSSHTKIHLCFTTEVVPLLSNAVSKSTTRRLFPTRSCLSRPRV